MPPSAPEGTLSDGKTPQIVVCSCEKTFTPDLAAMAAGLGVAEGSIVACSNLCGGEQDRLARLAGGARSLVLACRQEEATLRGVLEDAGYSGSQTYLDIRNAGGWSTEAAAAGPKMAALLAGALLEPPALPFVTLESQGVTLVYGTDATAIDVARRLADTLDVTVILRSPKDVAPPTKREFPIARGRIRQASGHLGAFQLVVDDFALSLASSRAALAFGDPRDQARSTCDLIIDVTGDRPLFSADDLRDGYLRADPRDPVGLDRLVSRARDLVGTFDKPKYITFDSGLCAHSRSTITGCTRCIEICPTGAISPAGDHVAIDPQICAGCGGCASVCPTGAASYALPATDYVLKKVRTMLRAYDQAGGRDAVLLFHDADHGEPMIDALARFGDGLPARVIPLALNEVTQLDLAEVAGSFAYGAAAIAVLTQAKPKHDITPLVRLGETLSALLPALGHAPEAFAVLGTDDPDALLAGLRALPAGSKAGKASFLPLGAKRPLTMLALREWHAVAPEQPAIVPLAKGAGFGKVEVDAEGCTLCLSCVSTCPVDALSANPDRPELRFQEDLCVQCGLCQATCPEKVISLVPQLDFTRINAAPVSLKQEEPYPCDKCGKLFGTRSTIEKIKTKLGGKHWMFSGPNADRLKLIGYCDDCRIETATLQGFDPYAGPERPRVRTTEDYFRTHPEDEEKS
ncbi:4Fe-4S binding protein [Rhabdaerophilum sp. SD176]|uniref:4Fe-4S binding protein n=1 Tax=Rhabdaerophilum sp. SD176 TaxID=2983548 RepID=UPI0024DF49A3|nr:4Fe-4S binding protein [Rhabdaerophilum sp. SD176]